MTYVKTYQFGTTSFSNFVWLQGGAPFQNPTRLEVEMVTSGAYRVEVFDPADLLVAKSQPRPNTNGGWEVFEFGGMGGEFVPPIAQGYYRIRMVNIEPGTRQVYQGILTMKLPGHPWDQLRQGVANVFGKLFR